MVKISQGGGWFTAGMSTKYLTSSKDIAKGLKGRTIPLLAAPPLDASPAESAFLPILPIATSPPL